MDSIKRIVLTCGYRGTGKDSLKTSIDSKLNGFDNVNRWMVYSESDKTFPIVKRQRRAFADCLKEEVNKELGFKEHEYETLELQKDTLIIDGKTLRQHYIDRAALRRAQDPLYFCKKVDYSPSDIAITDWRNVNELEYLLDQEYEVTTVRVYRSKVPVPSSSSFEEHALDHICTDYLLVTSIEDFTEALKRFPQYTNYVLTSSI